MCKQIFITRLYALLKFVYTYSRSYEATTFEKEQASASVHFIAFLISTCNERCLYTLFTEFSRHPELDENVAVIVFGRETKFLHYYSTDYPAIKQSIGKIFTFSVC